MPYVPEVELPDSPRPGCPARDVASPLWRTRGCGRETAAPRDKTRERDRVLVASDPGRWRRENPDAFGEGVPPIAQRPEHVRVFRLRRGLLPLTDEARLSSSAA